MPKTCYQITLKNVIEAYQGLPKEASQVYFREYCSYLQASVCDQGGYYYPGGYEGNLNGYIKDAERGSSQAYLTYFVDTQFTQLGLAALLQQFVYVTPKLEQFVGYNQELLHMPVRLLLGSFQILSLPTHVLYECWFDNLLPGGEPRLHILFTSLIVFSPTEKACVLPGTLEAVYSLTAQGYRFDYLEVSNSLLRDLVLYQGNLLPNLAWDQAAKETYLNTLNQHLESEFAQHKEHLLEEITAVLAQCSDQNIFYYQVLQRISACLKSSNSVSALQSFINNLSEKQWLSANFEINSTVLNFINAVQLDDFKLQLSCNLFSEAVIEHYVLSLVTRVAYMAIIRIQFLPEQAQVLHLKLSRHVTWPSWLEIKAQEVLSSYPQITQNNANAFLEECHSGLFFYAIGYYEYLAWICNDLHSLKPFLPQYLIDKLQRKIKAAQKADNSLFEAKDINKWFTKLYQLHTVFQILVNEPVRLQLKSLEKLPEQEKLSLLKLNFYGFRKNKKRLQNFLENYIVSLKALNYFYDNREKAYINIDQLFNQIKHEFKIDPSYFIKQLAPCYLAAAFSQPIQFFEFTEKDLSIFDRIGNDEILKIANSIIEEKIKLLAIATKHSNLYNQAQLRHYYTKCLLEALQYRCSLKIIHLDPQAIEKIITLNDQYYYHSVIMGILALCGAISLFTARAVLLVTLLVLPKLPLPALFMATIGSPPTLLLGLIVLGIIEFGMLTQGIKKLKVARYSFFYSKASPLDTVAAESTVQHNLNDMISLGIDNQYGYNILPSKREIASEEEALHSWLLPDNQTLTPVV